jgi:hypothetical protein
MAEVSMSRAIEQARQRGEPIPHFYEYVPYQLKYVKKPGRTATS